MKKSKAETAETHKKIVEIAAQAFKKQGIDATGVAEIMAAAGLTHGAFYRHFASKEALVAEAAADSMDVFVEAAKSAALKGQTSFIKYLRGYMTPEIRDGELGGCPVIQLGSELARFDPDTREGVSNGLKQLIEIAAKAVEGGSGKSAEDDVTFTLSAMIGAITMSRLVDDEKLSARVLEITKNRLLKLPPKVLSDKPKSDARQRKAVA